MYATVQGLCYYSVSSIADVTCEETTSVGFSTTPLVCYVVFTGKHLLQTNNNKQAGNVQKHTVVMRLEERIIPEPFKFFKIR